MPALHSFMSRVHIPPSVSPTWNFDAHVTMSSCCLLPPSTPARPQGVKHAHIISEVDASGKAIRAAFGHADRAMRKAKQELVECMVLILSNKHTNAQPSMPAFVQSMAGLTLGTTKGYVQLAAAPCSDHQQGGRGRSNQRGGRGSRSNSQCSGGGHQRGGSCRPHSHNNRRH